MMMCFCRPLALPCRLGFALGALVHNPKSVTVCSTPIRCLSSCCLVLSKQAKSDRPNCVQTFDSSSKSEPFLNGSVSTVKSSLMLTRTHLTGRSRLKELPAGYDLSYYQSHAKTLLSFCTRSRSFGTSCRVATSQKTRRINVDKTKKKAKVVKESVEETVREWKEDIVITVPNALTSLRIAMTPFLGYLVVHESYSWACGLFIVAGITDLLDGYIARNFPGQASAFGSYLDPLADKLLVSVLFLSLTVVDLIPVPLTALVILRDALLISGGFYVRYTTLPPPKTLKRYFDVTHATAQLQPTLISKLNTAVQLILVTASLGAPVFGYMDHVGLHALWYLTASTTIASGITYMFAKDTFKVLRQTRKIKKS